MNPTDSYQALLTELIRLEPAGSDWSAGAPGDRRFIYVERGMRQMPDQGWKLHVSATPWSAEDVLRIALPVLLRDDAPFKVVASPRLLEEMNQGRGTLSQVGKFITVYPRGDGQAVRLAAALDEATHDLVGPSVPSDRPLRAGSLVHYRFGSFVGRVTHAPTGEPVSMLVGPNGELEQDRRGTEYAAPKWAIDPFVAAGIADPEPSGTLGGRYVPVVTLHRSVRGTVQLAVDLESKRSCVIKRAYRAARAGPGGRDARDDLRREIDVISRLDDDPAVPRILDVLEDETDLYLVLEHVEGTTLSRYLAEMARSGRFLSEAKVIEWGGLLAQTIERFHSRGLTYRDLTSMNVIVRPDGRLGLVDFELARDLETEDEFFSAGTPGYWSPQQARGDAVSVGDDVFSFGALLYFMLTNAEPGMAPDTEDILTRPLELLRPGVGAGLVRVVERCLRPDPSERFGSMRDVDAALASIGTSPVRSLPAPKRSHEDFLGLARELGDCLVEALEADSGPEALSMPMHLAGGVGGSVLALTEIADETSDERYLGAVAESVGLLVESRPEEPASHGLYVGEAGIAAAILRAGQVLSDRSLVDDAARRGRLVAASPFGMPEVISGTAGRVLLYLLLWDETHDEEHLAHVRGAADALVDAAEDAGDGAVRWRIPPGWDELSGTAQLGYAHGAAGVADVLLEAFETTGDERFLDSAKRGAAWLRRLAVPALHDGRGLTWPYEEGSPPVGALWCHGSTGIGRFFLHATRFGVADAEAMAVGAAHMVADGARFISPLTCHGLAGNIDFLIDMWRATNNAMWLERANKLAELLVAFRVQRDGRWLWVGGLAGDLGPDYLNGYAGIACCLLRLADPSRPSLISREGFRFSRRRSLARSPRN